ncbi:hypothetical protein P4475_17790 [Halalkalibacterium halodurans]|uniref:hypothetical protein n=1 Tax=Halalkalibacterium halodurans TaxID=86665 RepID=UPI0010681EEE|nr:hypothetical protein [Halalkalibacterium halodurans]MED3648625.1 hypothetical protein [Halalkalibacterium halodurans]TES47607.1 hypothetical protein E2L07_18700 [Halalkalibacterium halodurans]
MAYEFERDIRLTKPQDVRRMLARVINGLLQDGELTIEKARAIATLSNTILRAMEVGELAEKIEDMEETIKQIHEAGEGGRTNGKAQF